MSEDFKRNFELYEVESNTKKTAKYILIWLLVFAAICVGIILGLGGLSASGRVSNAAVSLAADDYANSGLPGAMIGETRFQNIITAETRMVYEYYFPEINFTDYVEASAPRSLIGASESTISGIMQEWEIISFSPEEVVSRKTILPGESPVYILTAKDGYLAVYYEDSVYGGILKEVTSTPIAGLNEDEIARLERGIYIYGMENLMRALQDYGS